MQDFQWAIESVKRTTPEIAVVAGILLVILLDLFPRVSKTAVMLLALVTMLAALVLAVLLVRRFPEPYALYRGAAAHDALGLFFRVLFCAMGVLGVMFSWPVVRRWQTGQGEFFALLLSCVFGMQLMALANHLLMMFVALEFVSVTSYVLTGLQRGDRRSVEASLKYILYGAAAGGVMLFGMSFLYGLTGKVNVVEIGESLRGRELSPVLGITISVLIAGGFAYKMAAAPFHMWCPDVYQGAPTPVTAFFSIGPKIAGFAMFVRFLHGVMPAPTSPELEWRIVIGAMAFLTMAIGNLVALWQNNLKRLMAYSGIAHAGYMLLVFLVFRQENIASLLFYSVVYLFMNLGAFLVVIILEQKYGVETVEDCRGMGWADPALCALMGVFLFSLVGLPPLAGFAGKLQLFGFVIDGAVSRPEGWDWLAISLVVAAVLFSVVSLYYYARIIGNMFLRPGEPQPMAVRTPLLSGLTWIMAAGTVLFGVYWGWLYDLCRQAASGILGQ